MQQQAVIIGGGIMGRGIAQLFVQNGYTVSIVENQEEQAKQLPEILENSWQRLVTRGKLTSMQVQKFLEQLTVTSDLSAVSQADVVIEAVFEDLELKQEVLSQVERFASTKTLIASNTSTFSITAIASALQNPARLIGLHFFNPPPVMKLVEVVKGLQTNETIVQQAIQLAKNIGKQPVLCQSFPGFIVNRICRPYYCESFKMLDEQATSIDNIDIALEGSGLFPMGVFRLVDLIGVETNFRNTKSMFEAFFYDNRYKPSLTQSEYVNAGFFGQKVNQGLYYYQDNQAMRHTEFVPTGQTLSEEVLLQSTIICPFWIQNFKKIIEQKGISLDMQQGINSFLKIGSVQILATGGQLAERVFQREQMPTIIMDWILSENTSVLAIQANHAVKNEMLEQVASFFDLLGIKLVIVNSPAMVVMRLAVMLINEALEAIQQGVCNDHDCNLALRLGMNFQFDIISLAKQIGYSTVRQILNNLHDLFQDEKYRPSLELNRRADDTIQ